MTTALSIMITVAIIAVMAWVFTWVELCDERERRKIAEIMWKHYQDMENEWYLECQKLLDGKRKVKK